MSDGSEKVFLEPLKNIGAQDILKVGSSYEGVLRKKGGRFSGINLIGSFRWKRRFVVISQGCMYCFKDEYSSRPQSAFSLQVYDRVEETANPHMLNCFEILHEDPNHPPQCFAAETDAKQKAWVGYIREAINQAHQHTGGSQSGSDEGISMTRSKPARPLPQPVDLKFTHVSKSEYSLDSDDELDPYDEVEETQATVKTSTQQQKGSQLLYNRSPKNIPGAVSVFPTAQDNRKSISHRPKIDLPPLPGEEPQRQSVTSPKKSGLPDYVNEDGFPPETYKFDSKEKEKAHSLLKTQPVGTFLVRLGNSTPTVLSVKTPIGIKEFQITEDGSHVTLDRKTSFPSTSAMLLYYSLNDLPKNEYKVKLLRGYNSKNV